MAIIDISVDLWSGVSLGHILTEAVVIPLAAFGFYNIWKNVTKLKRENTRLKVDLELISKIASQWKEEAARHLAGLSIAIDSQMTRWGLSPAEKEVALLLLKGLSHKEIAEIRKTSERTSRQQSQIVYEKSGLNGRAELAAFFLEDLLTPLDPSDKKLSRV